MNPGHYERFPHESSEYRAAHEIAFIAGTEFMADEINSISKAKKCTPSKANIQLKSVSVDA